MLLEKKINKTKSLIAKILFLLFFLASTKSYSFNIQEVADSVFVHYGIQEETNAYNKGDIANIGFIIGKDSIMVIDTGGTQLIGRKLLEKIRTISNLPISHIVITHSHPDHFLGTQAFSDENAKIVGHEKLNRSLVNNFEFYRNLQYTNIELEEIKNLKLVEAEVLVKTNQKKIIDLGERLIELKAWKSGHTDNDLSIYDLKTKTFWSENVFVKRTPSIRASIKGWKKNLEDIMKMDIKLIVPGHGKAISKIEAIKPMMNYFDRLIEQVRNFHVNNRSLQESINSILQKEILNPSKVNKENWVLFTEYHYTNVTKAFTELEWE